MLDLKAKLASAGLISAEDVQRAERQAAARKEKKRSSRGAPRPVDRRGRLPIAKLEGKPKSEIYPVVRKWIDRIRLDAHESLPSESSVPYHFVQSTGRVGRLILEPALVEQIRVGKAGVVAYMSNHGIAHAVVPAEGARDLAEVVPSWLRVLEGHPGAGTVETPKSPG